MDGIADCSLLCRVRFECTACQCPASNLAVTVSVHHVMLQVLYRFLRLGARWRCRLKEQAMPSCRCRFSTTWTSPSSRRSHLFEPSHCIRELTSMEGISLILHTTAARGIVNTFIVHLSKGWSFVLHHFLSELTTLVNTRVKQTGGLPKLKVGTAAHVTVEVSQTKSDSLLCTVHN